MTEDFHLFQRNGKKIVFFPKKRLFAHISDIAFEILKRRDRTEIKREHLVDNFESQQIKECSDEISTLEQKGYFVPVANIFSKPLNKDKIIGHQPSGIVLNVAQICNMACKYCYGSGGSYGSNVPFMSQDTAKAAIELLIKRSENLKNYHIFFFGGEPLLNFPLIKYVVNLCRQIENNDQKKIYFSVTTNATILDNSIIQFLRENRFGVMVSFDGTKKYQNKYRPLKNGKGSFDIVTANIRKLSNNLMLHDRGTLVREMVDKRIINKIIRNSMSMGIKKLVLSPADCSKIDGSCLSLNDNDRLKLCHLFEKISEQNLINIKKRIKNRIFFDPYAPLIRDFYEGKTNKYYQCGAFFGMSAVSTDGNIFPCHRFVGLKSFIIGDVFNGMMNDKIYCFLEDFRRVRNETCAYCWLNKICGGPCYYSLANQNGTFNRPDKIYCQAQKQKYESVMYFMIKYYNEIFESPYTYLNVTRHI